MITRVIGMRKVGYAISSLCTAKGREVYTKDIAIVFGIIVYICRIIIRM